jgi:tetratricopeptide (TPR) repeat protein
VHGEHHTITHLDLAALGACYGAANRVAEAHQILEAALRSYDAGSGNARGRSAIEPVRCEFGRTLLREGRFAEAEAVLRQTLAGYDRGELRPLNLRLNPRPRAVSGLGQALAGQGKFAEAETLVVQAFQELQANEQRIAGDRSGMLREALDAVIALYRAWGKPEKVAEWSAKLGELPGAQR